MSAPEGIGHHNAHYSIEFIDRIRAEYERQPKARKYGKRRRRGPSFLARKYGLPVDTVKDWIYCRTRIRS